MYQPPCQSQKWNWSWRRESCWMVTNCRPTCFYMIFILMTCNKGCRGCRGIWEEWICELQKSCLAWLILWVGGINSQCLKNWILHQMCWWDWTSPLPCDTDSFSWLWRTVWTVIHVIFVAYIHEFWPRCFMALIRGTTCNFPCPVCLVPGTQLSDGSEHPLRTSESMQQVYKEAKAMASKTQRDEYLKNYGLCNVEVGKTYWSLVYNPLTNFYIL